MKIVISVVLQIYLFFIYSPETDGEKGKAEKIRSLLQGTGSTDLKELQSLSYSGLPVSVRGTTWKLLAVSSLSCFSPVLISAQILHENLFTFRAICQPILSVARRPYVVNAKSTGSVSSSTTTLERTSLTRTHFAK